MDKAHLHASLHKLMDYLITHGYDQPINKKKLMSPSGRDFNNITGFLFRQLDPNYMVREKESGNLNPNLCADVSNRDYSSRLLNGCRQSQKVRWFLFLHPLHPPRPRKGWGRQGVVFMGVCVCHVPAAVCHTSLLFVPVGRETRGASAFDRQGLTS